MRLKDIERKATESPGAFDTLTKAEFSFLVDQIRMPRRDCGCGPLGGCPDCLPKPLPDPAIHTVTTPTLKLEDAGFQYRRPEGCRCGEPWHGTPPKCPAHDRPQPFAAQWLREQTRPFVIAVLDLLDKLETRTRVIALDTGKREFDSLKADIEAIRRRFT